MALEQAAYIDGRVTGAASLRRTAYASAGGNTSIVEPTAFKVTATTPASDKVLVYPGSAHLVSPHASGQAYTVTNNALAEVAIPANGTSNPVTRRVVVAVQDPNQAGMPADPGAPDPLAYFQAGTTTPTDRPVLPCADITIPAQTGVITNGMLTDQRPFVGHEQSDRRMLFPAGTVTMSTGSYTSWPLSGFGIDIPEWATHLDVVITLTGAQYSGSDMGRAGVRVVFNGASGQQNAQNGKIERAAGLGSMSVDTTVAGTFALTDADKEATRYFGCQAVRSSGTGNWTMTNQTQVIYQWWFRQERA